MSFLSNAVINGGLIHSTNNAKLLLGSKDMSDNITSDSMIHRIHTKHLNVCTDGEHSNLYVDANIVKLHGDILMENSKNEPLLSVDESTTYLTNTMIILDGNVEINAPKGETNALKVNGDVVINGNIISTNSSSSGKSNFLEISNIESKIYDLKGVTTVLFHTKTDSTFKFSTMGIMNQNIHFIASNLFSGKIKLKPTTTTIVHPVADNVELSLTGKGQSTALFINGEFSYLLNAGCEVNF